MSVNPPSAEADEYDEIAGATREELERRVDQGINSVVAPEKPKADAAAEEFISERKEFEIDWTNGAGRRYQGKFVCRVASVQDHIMIGVNAAKWRGGISPQMLDELTLSMCESLATVQVVVKAVGEAPSWFVNLAELNDTDVVGLIYREVSNHWASFRERGRQTGAGAGA